jgi:type II secretory pathway pseudopilin PulG
MKTVLRNRSCRERGYVLLVLLLFVALLSIGMLAAVERFEFQFKRDREEELIHRGVQYSRAIRRFIKQFGRYPSSVEELESTNNMRFLRKRYKDPITGKDFRALHMEDVAYLNVRPAPQAPAATVSKTALAVSSDPAPSEKPGPGEEVVGDPADPTGSDVPIPSKSTSTAAEPNANESQPTINDRPIVGVASSSNAKTIREFHNQNRYRQWLFIYNPATDRAGVLTTPDQPLLNGARQGNAQGPESNPQTGPGEAASTQDPGSPQNQQ